MTRARRPVRSARGALALAALCLVACKGRGDANPQAIPSAAPSAASSAGAAKGAVRSVKPKTEEKKPPSHPDEHAVVKVPAGKLIAGTPCGGHPRSPSIEPAGVEVQLAAFDIDAYPYPNDPRQPPKTGVTREEASKLCAERGRRLCTELEWERACKGPENNAYPWGKQFKPKTCPTSQVDIASLTDYPECKSSFGVHATHGYVWEWTDSAWGRGSEEELVTQRGGVGGAPYADQRCSAARGVPGDKADKRTGFRCCGGARNPASVELELPDPPLEELESITPDAALLTRLERAVTNGGLPRESNVDYQFTKVWLWRPEPLEELHVALYSGTPQDGGPSFVQPVVIQLCTNRAILLSRLQGPVARLDEPRKGSGAYPTLLIKGEVGDHRQDIELFYQYGQVGVKPHPWIPTGTRLKSEPPEPKPAASAAPVTSAIPSAPAASAAP